MGYPIYYVEADDTLPHLFDTFDGGDGSSITMTGLAVTDIEVYKDGSTTQRSSDSGYTLLDTDGIDFDGTTGIHGFSLDLSDNTDAGFYAVGSWYHVVVSSITVDAQTVNFVAFAFRIVSETRGMSGTALPDAAADAAGGLPISDAGGLDIDAKLAATNEVTAARMGALTDWLNGGRLDLLLDAIPTTPMRGTDGANTTTPPTAAAVADAVLDEALSEHVTAGTLGKAVADIETDATAILADTAEIGAAGAGLTDLGGMSTAMKAEVNAEADTALTDYDPPTKAELDVLGTAALATEAKQDIIDTNVDTLITKLTTGITSLAEWLGLLAGKQTGNATALTEIKATGAGSGTYDPTTDSNEALRDNQGGGGGGATQNAIVGGFGRSGSSYFWTAVLRVDGAVVTSGISAPAVVGVYGNNGATSLGYVEGTAPAVDATTQIMYGSFTLGTAPSNGNPAVLLVTAVYDTVTYRGALISWGN